MVPGLNAHSDLSSNLYDRISVMIDALPFGSKLPEYDSLIIKGPYPPPAPLHLALNHLLQEPIEDSSDVLLVSTSRDTLASALQNYNDSQLNCLGQSGEGVRLLSRIRILYVHDLLIFWIQDHVGKPLYL